MMALIMHFLFPSMLDGMAVLPSLMDRALYTVNDADFRILNSFFLSFIIHSIGMK